MNFKPTQRRRLPAKVMNSILGSSLVAGISHSEALTHFEFSGCDFAFARWQADTNGDFDKLEIPDKENICSPAIIPASWSDCIR